MTGPDTTVGTPVVARPRRIRFYVIPAALVVFAAFAVMGVLLRQTPTGAQFAVSDQVALIVIGVILALAVLALLRPRVRADTDGIEVRNVLNGRTFRWADVRGVSFPDGAPWARVELLADEYYPVMGVQAQDGQRSVQVMRELRALHRGAQPHGA